MAGFVLSLVLVPSAAAGPWQIQPCLGLGPDRRSISAAQMAMEPPPTFATAYATKLPSWLIERTAALGFEVPTPVQAEALDTVLSSLAADGELSYLDWRGETIPW